MYGKRIQRDNTKSMVGEFKEKYGKYGKRIQGANKRKEDKR